MSPDHEQPEDSRIEASSTNGGVWKGTHVPPPHIRERDYEETASRGTRRDGGRGLAAGAAQAEPVPLTLEQMDQMTAGQISASVILTSSSEASSRAEVIGEGTAWVSASASSSASLSSDIVCGDMADAE